MYGSALEGQTSTAGVTFRQHPRIDARSLRHLDRRAGRFAAELAHEIRNPLTAIKINLKGLARDTDQGRIPAPLGVKTANKP
jgi:signal transduction histidine kinase